jgi:hypothetical protein
MAMPPQLARANRRRSRHSEPRPTVELMPAICITDLRDAIPRNHATNIYSNPFKYPQIRHLRLSYRSIEIVDHHDRSQVFGITWIRTGFGAHRAIFVCNSCRCGAIRLFARYGTYACCHCHRALYASQKHNQTGRKRCKPPNCACNSAACQTSTNRSRPSPNGRAAGHINASATKSKALKLKPTHDGSGSPLVPGSSLTISGNSCSGLVSPTLG